MELSFQRQYDSLGLAVRTQLSRSICRVGQNDSFIRIFISRGQPPSNHSSMEPSGIAPCFACQTSFKIHLWFVVNNTKPLVSPSMADEMHTSVPLDLADFTVSEDLVPSIPQKKSQTVTLDFDGFLQPPLLLQTNEKQCGGQLWPGGMVLTRFLLQYRRNDLSGKTMFVVRSDVPFPG